MKKVIEVGKSVLAWVWKQVKLLPSRLKGAYDGFTKPDSGVSA